MSRRWRVLCSILRVIVKMRAILNKVNKSREKMKLYCCLFPNDYEFERETLVRLWMAMGFSSQSCVEKFCERYFDILLEEQYIVFSSIDTVTRRNLYKVNHQGKNNTGEKKTINKEDLYTVLEDEDANGSKIGHISVVSNCINETTFKKLQNFDGELRTLLFIHNYGSTLNKIPSDMFLILEFLRALDLSGNDIIELPRSIGNVSQLRYLDLSFTLIESLPESIDQLHQLQTLKLQGCTHLHELPRGIKELVCLRHLDLDVLGQLTFLPKGIGALTELCTLSAFIVDSEEGCTIQELKFLNKLRGSFCISGLENVAHVDDVQEAALQDKKYLTHLQLRWSDLILYSTEDKQLSYNIIASLNLNKGLQDLQIVCYPGLHIPAWVDFREQQNLLSITLLNCNNNDLSLPLGQLPNLKYLSIIHMNRVTKIDGWFHGGGDEAYVAFPKLERLEIECMLSLETWIDVFNHDDFPFLSTLIIKQCPELTRLPFLPHLQVLKHLEMSHCTVFECLPEGTLPASLETLIVDDCPFLKKRCSKEGEDWHKVKHIPNIWIDLQNVCSTHEDGDFEDSSSKLEDICSSDEDVSEDINLSAGGETDPCMDLPENTAACSQLEILTTDSANKELASASRSNASSSSLQAQIEWIDLLICSEPNNPDLYSDRAQAKIELSNFAEAVADANKAIELDSSLAEAYLLKGTACMKLEIYQTAKTAFQAGATLAPEDPRFTNLIKECDERIAEEDASLSKPSIEKSTGSVVPGGSDINSTTAQGDTVPAVIGLTIPASAVSVSKPKFRHEFYQNPFKVVVTVFAKGIPAKNVAVDYGEQILSVSIDLPGEEPYRLQTRLFGKIIPSECRYDVLSTKIEIWLAKAEPIQWTTLECTKYVAVPQKMNISTPAQRPSYPSSKHRGVDWDKLEAEVKKEEKGERLDGDAALNMFFQDIYRDADEDTRRAMQKSFVEGNGTVLSINWKEVGSKKVEETPPDSMEWEI